MEIYKKFKLQKSPEQSIYTNVSGSIYKRKSCLICFLGEVLRRLESDQAKHSAKLTPVQREAMDWIDGAVVHFCISAF